MAKKTGIYLLLGAASESIITFVITMWDVDGYEFMASRFIANAIAFALFYWTIPFILRTIRKWKEKTESNWPERICVICQLLTICMVIGIVLSHDTTILAICEIGSMVMSAILIINLLISLIKSGDKEMPFTVFKWILMLVIMEYSMFGFGIVR